MEWEEQELYDMDEEELTALRMEKDAMRSGRTYPHTDKYRRSRPNSDCFIATAVYGDINAPEVQVLRNFKDNVLMESGLGRKAVNLYYSGLGKRTADFIKNHASFMIPITRRGLDYLVQRYESKE